MALRDSRVRVNTKTEPTPPPRTRPIKIEKEVLQELLTYETNRINGLKTVRGIAYSRNTKQVGKRFSIEKYIIDCTLNHSDYVKNFQLYFPPCIYAGRNSLICWDLLDKQATYLDVCTVKGFELIHLESEHPEQSVYTILVYNGVIKRFDESVFNQCKEFAPVDWFKFKTTGKLERRKDTPLDEMLKQVKDVANSHSKQDKGFVEYKGVTQQKLQQSLNQSTGLKQNPTGESTPVDWLATEQVSNTNYLENLQYLPDILQELKEIRNKVDYGVAMENAKFSEVNMRLSEILSTLQNVDLNNTVVVGEKNQLKDTKNVTTDLDLIKYIFNRFNQSTGEEGVTKSRAYTIIRDELLNTEDPNLKAMRDVYLDANPSLSGTKDIPYPHISTRHIIRILTEYYKQESNGFIVRL